MGYAYQNLQKDEKIVARAQFSKLAALPSLFFIIEMVILGIFMKMLFKDYITLIICIIIGIIPLIVALLSISSRELVVTNKRVLGKNGIFGLNTIDILFSKVETVTVSAGLIGRIAGYYSLKFTGSGSAIMPFRL